MKYVEGEQVLAKAPNTDDYKKGKVLIAKGDVYRIQFEDGAEHTVYENDMQSDRPSRSAARTRTKVARKSPSRKSPSRKSPSRQSPSRKSPSRRSPGRSPGRSPTSKPRKLVPRINKLPEVSGSRSDDDKASRTDSQSTMSEADNISELIPLQSRLKEGTVGTRRSIRIRTNMMKSDRVISTRSIDRAVSLPVERKTIMYEYLSENKERGFSVQREPDIQKLHYEEDILPDSSTTNFKGKKEMELVSKPQEWGGWLGAMCLIILLPVAIILPQVACFNNKCLLDGYHWPKKLQSYLNYNAALLYLGFLFSLAILSILPIGKLVDGQQNKIGKLQYRMNGLLSAIVALAVLGICEYQGYKVSDYIIRSIFKFSIVGWIVGTLISISLYIKANKVSVSALNMYGSTGNIIYDFWQGREINPRLGKLDIKIVLHRFAIIGTLLINVAIIIKSLQGVDYFSYHALNLTILTSSALQIFYCLDYLFFEASTLTSFKIMYEGTGYMVCVGNLLYPFLMTLGPRYVLSQNIQRSEYILGALTVAFFSGYFIYRVSNWQKDQFRRNPYTESLSNLDTILTSRGKKLIVSGFWGYVRHPNYLGDLMMILSMSSIELSNDILMYYFAILYTIFLIHRALRDDSRCSTRYGSAWEQYCLRVKSMIFKRVF